jgi:hypothetical protein
VFTVVSHKEIFEDFFAMSVDKHSQILARARVNRIVPVPTPLKPEPVDNILLTKVSFEFALKMADNLFKPLAADDLEQLATDKAFLYYFKKTKASKTKALPVKKKRSAKLIRSKI